MDARSIGLVRSMRDIKAGEFILFKFHNSVEPGIIVELNDNNKRILHLAAVEGGKFSPKLYDYEYSFNETVILIENARIVPVFAPEHTGIGRYFEARVSRALYVDQNGVYITASHNQMVFTFNLFNGQRANLFTDNAVYTKFWYIEVPGSNGDFERYLEFDA